MQLILMKREKDIRNKHFTDIMTYLEVFTKDDTV